MAELIRVCTKTICGLILLVLLIARVRGRHLLVLADLILIVLMMLLLLLVLLLIQIRVSRIPHGKQAVLRISIQYSLLLLLLLLLAAYLISAVSIRNRGRTTRRRRRRCSMRLLSLRWLTAVDFNVVATIAQQTAVVCLVLVLIQPRLMLLLNSRGRAQLVGLRKKGVAE